MTTAASPDLVSRERELNSLYLVTVVVLLVVVTATFGALIFAFWWRSQNAYLWGHLQIPNLLWVTTAILLASSWMLERHAGAEGGPAYRVLPRVAMDDWAGRGVPAWARDGLVAGDAFECGFEDR